MDDSGSEMPHSEGRAWLLMPPAAVPERWRDRVVNVSLIGLLPEETAQILAGDRAEPALEGRDVELARLLVQGLTIEAIARAMGMSVRGVQRRLTRLRERIGVESTGELRGLLARWGFGGPLA